MDILSEVLRTVRFASALDLRADFSAPWTVETESCHEFAEAGQLGPKQIVQFHIIAEGECWVQNNSGNSPSTLIGRYHHFPSWRFTYLG